MRARRVHAVLLPAVVSAAALSCAGDGSRIPVLDDGGGRPFPATMTAIQDHLLSRTCAPQCHEPGGIAPFSMRTRDESRANLVGVPNAEGALDPFGNLYLRVDPGSPSTSYIILKLQGSPAIVGGRMPLDRPPLDPEVIDTIAEWIRNGAPDD